MLNPKPRIPWMNTAYSLIGTQAKRTDMSNRKIMEWAKIAQLDNEYTNDRIAWCGLFVSFCMADNGLPIVESPLWAKSWNTYGKKLSTPEFGAILIFTRNGGGHVSFYVGEGPPGYFKILGGNQAAGHEVCIENHSASSLIGVRWPPGMEKFL